MPWQSDEAELLRDYSDLSARRDTFPNWYSLARALDVSTWRSVLWGKGRHCGTGQLLNGEKVIIGKSRSLFLCVCVVVGYILMGRPLAACPIQATQHFSSQSDHIIPC